MSGVKCNECGSVHTNSHAAGCWVEHFERGKQEGERLGLAAARSLSLDLEGEFFEGSERDCRACGAALEIAHIAATYTVTMRSLSTPARR